MSVECYLETRGKTSKETDTNTESNQGCHGAVWDCGRKLNKDAVVLV